MSTIEQEREEPRSPRSWREDGLLEGGTWDPTEPDCGADAATRTLERKSCACRFLPGGGEGRGAAAMLPYTVNFKVSARTLTGALNAHNKAAVDW